MPWRFMSECFRPSPHPRRHSLPPNSREMAPADRFRGEYLLLSIIPTGSKPKRSPPWMVAVGVLIAVGAALLFVLGQ
jgi:hypothetical protein